MSNLLYSKLNYLTLNLNKLGQIKKYHVSIFVDNFNHIIDLLTYPAVIITIMNK